MFPDGNNSGFLFGAQRQIYFRVLGNLLASIAARELTFLKGIIFLEKNMNSEVDRPGRLEIVKIRRESYDRELVPEALNMIRAVAHADPDIELALRGLSDEQLQVLKNAETEEEFGQAILAAFGDRSIQVVAGSLGNLRSSLFVFNGRQGDSLEEIFCGNEDMISRVRKVIPVAREILQQLRSDILTPHRESVLTVIG